MNNDNASIDAQESLKNNLDLFVNNVYEQKADQQLSLKNMIADVIAKYGKLINKDKDTQKLIPLLDSSMQLDGAFFQFCKENKLTVTTLQTDTVNILPYVEMDYDPFMVNGLFVIQNDEFAFIKSTLLKFVNGADSATAITILSTDDYPKYLAIKEKYVAWIIKREGITVKVVGGEEYTQDISNDTFDELFFGEKVDQKKLIKDTLDKFYASKEFYKDNNIPWNFSMVVHGDIGCGKSKVINTIISEYNLDPLTVNYYNVDDSILTSAFKISENKSGGILFIDDFDELVAQNFISVENLFGLIQTNPANHGLLIVLSCRKLPDLFKDIVGIDRQFELTNPEYGKSVAGLFSKFITNAANLKELQESLEKSGFSYGYIYKLYKMFAKSICYLDVSTMTPKKKNDLLYLEFKNIFKVIQKEHSKLLGKTKTKRIGLLDKV